MASNPIIQADAECEPCHGDMMRHKEKDSGPGVCRPLISTSSNETLKYEAEDYHFDFLVVCSKEDEHDAMQLQKFLKEQLDFTSKLLSNSVLPSDHLEEYLERTMFTLLYVTKSFSNCEWNRSIGPICHKRTLEEKKKQWTVVPVYADEKYQNELPLTLQYLPCIEYWREDRHINGFKDLVDRKKVELSQHRQSTSKKTEQPQEKMVNPVAGNRITPSTGRVEEVKRENVKAIEERVQDIALSSMLHVDRPSASTSPLIAVDAESSTQNDVTVDCVPGTLIKSTADSGVFSEGGMGVSSRVNVQNNTKAHKPSAEPKGAYKPKYEIEGPEDSDSN